jgi:hypothetical protein
MRKFFRSLKPAAGEPAEAPAQLNVDVPTPATDAAVETAADLNSPAPVAQFAHASVEYRDHFEGLWTDRLDVESVLERHRRAGRVSDTDDALLRDWIDDGYVKLPGAIPYELCEEIKRDIHYALDNGDARLRVIAPGENFGRPLEAKVNMRGMRVQDIYVHFESARQALFAEPIVNFLNLVFDASPLLLQSLTFELGSSQGFHRDTAYVVIDPPLALAASWIALEDVRPGSGALTYYHGSHRIPGRLFSDYYKFWHPTRDGVSQHDQFMTDLVAKCEAAGLERRELLARQGDVLIWSADLVHGGSLIQDEALTRQSLVGHYCPNWGVPLYFDQFPHLATRRFWRGGEYASMHYAISELV